MRTDTVPKLSARARGPEPWVLGLLARQSDRQYWCAAARRANLVVPEIGVLKWFLKMLLNGSVNFNTLAHIIR